MKAVSNNLDHRIDEPAKAMSDNLNHRVSEAVKAIPDRFANHLDNSAKRTSSRSDKTAEEACGSSEEIAKEKLNEISESLELKKRP